VRALALFRYFNESSRGRRQDLLLYSFLTLVIVLLSYFCCLFAPRGIVPGGVVFVDGLVFF